MLDRFICFIFTTLKCSIGNLVPKLLIHLINIITHFKRKEPMSNYINFIDFKAIQLGDLANQIGDYKCACENYSKALIRLRKYQGDSMHPIMMASGLVAKIEEISKKGKYGNSILKYDVWTLSKTSFVKGNQCSRYLYLDKYKKQEKTPISQEKQILFNQGNTFEDLVRNKEFPGGVNIKDVVGNFAYFNSYTKFLLKSSKRIVIYEATIIEEDVIVMFDVLTKGEDDLIDIYEIKLSTELNEAILSDLSIQYLIAKKRFGPKLNSFNVVLRTEENWRITNLTDTLENFSLETKAKIEAFKQILLSKEPMIEMGLQCNKPYECEFIDYCKNKSANRVDGIINRS